MCIAKTPKMPEPPPPPQELKTPDTLNANRSRRRNAGMGGGTMLGDAAGGVTTGSLNTGGATLLGG